MQLGRCAESPYADQRQDQENPLVRLHSFFQKHTGQSRAHRPAEAVRDFGYHPLPFEEGPRQEVRDYLKAKNTAR